MLGCFWRVLFGYGSRSMRAYSNILYHLHEAAASLCPRILTSSYPRIPISSYPPRILISSYPQILPTSSHHQTEMYGWARVSRVLVEAPARLSFTLVLHMRASTYFVTSLLNPCQEIRNVCFIRGSIYFTIGGKCIARANDFIRIGQDNQ